MKTKDKRFSTQHLWYSRIRFKPATTAFVTAENDRDDPGCIATNDCVKTSWIYIVEFTKKFTGFAPEDVQPP